MKIWKKALSAAVSAALIASLTASAAFATKAPTASGSDQTDVLDCGVALVVSVDLAICSQVADGISTVTLKGDDDAGSAAYSTYITATGATIIAVDGSFTLVGGIVTAPASADITDVTDTITLRAPSAPGSATITVYRISTATGFSSLEGTLTVTFTASSGLDVSKANSSVKTLEDCFLDINDAFDGDKVVSGPATPHPEPVGFLCVLVSNGNGAGVEDAVVTATITPVGALAGDFFGQTTTATTDADGVVWIQIWNSGLAGTATIGTSATIGGKTTNFDPVTFKFTGDFTSMVVTQTTFAGSGVTTGDEPYDVKFSDVAATYQWKDSVSNIVDAGVATTFSSSDTTILTTATGAYASSKGEIVVTCVKPGTATVTAKKTNVGGTVVSGSFSFACVDEASSAAVAFSATSVATGGSVDVIVSVVNAADGLSVVAVTNAGILIGDGVSAGVSAVVAVSNGKATFKLIAPNAAGVATINAFVYGLTATNSINVGAAPAPVTAGTNGTALGWNNAGPFSSTVKTATLGSVQTYQISFGAGAAGQSIGIYWRSKVGGVWGAYTLYTSKTADASGNVYFHVKKSAVASIYVYGRLSGVNSNAVAALWR